MIKVHILATARKIELFAFTELVFKSIRIGFPTADIHVTGNALTNHLLGKIQDQCDIVDAKLVNLKPTIHHDWINGILEPAVEPFWICDTDIHFFDSMERFNFLGSPLAGRRIPEFIDEFSGCLTRSRLHTSLLYMDPNLLSAAEGKFRASVADTPFTPISNLVDPIVVPFRGRGVFYDTCSMLYHAVGGHQFTDEENDAFAHFHFGTISDMVIPRLQNVNGLELERARNVQNPELMKNSWRRQQQYFESRQA